MAPALQTARAMTIGLTDILDRMPLIDCVRFISETEPGYVLYPRNVRWNCSETIFLGHANLAQERWRKVVIS